MERHIREFVRTAAAGEGKLIQAAPGLGKSHAMGEALRASGRAALVLFGTKRLAAEWSENFGFPVLEGRNRSNCERLDVVRALADSGYEVEKVACGTTGDPRCPYRTGCSYYRQFEYGGTAAAVTEQLWNTHALSGRDLIVLDDADLQRALVARGRTSTEQLGHSLRSLSGPRYATVTRVVLSLFVGSGSHPRDRRALLGGHAWDAISQAANSIGFDLLETLRRLEDEEGFYDATGQRRRSTRWPSPRRKGGGPIRAEDVERLPPRVVRTMIDVLLAEARAFRRGTDFNSYLRLVDDGIDVHRLKPPIPTESGLPVVANAAMLVLDATPIAPLTDWVLKDHRRLPVVKCSVALPATVRVAQYATAANSRSDVFRKERGYVREIAEERRLDVQAPGEEGLVGYKTVLPERLGFALDRFSSYGATRGGNQLSQVRRLHAVGRPMPPTDELLFLAQVIHHDDHVVSSELVLEPRAYAGQPWEIDVLDFADHRVAELLRAFRDEEMLQAIHRSRPNTLGLDGDDRPGLSIVLHTNYPVAGLRVDRLYLPRNAGPDQNVRRSLDASARITEAIERLTAEGKEPSIREIAASAGASRNTVSEHLKAHRTGRAAMEGRNPGCRPGETREGIRAD